MKQNTNVSISTNAIYTFLCRVKSLCTVENKNEEKPKINKYKDFNETLKGFKGKVRLITCSILNFFF